jgi:hypothetical protein
MKSPMPSDESKAPPSRLKRFLWALAAYAALAALAYATLGDAIIRTPMGSLPLAYGVWVILAGLAAKTWIAHKAGW